MRQNDSSFLGGILMTEIRKWKRTYGAEDPVLSVVYQALIVRIDRLCGNIASPSFPVVRIVFPENRL